MAARTTGRTLATGSLDEKAILVRLSLGRWTARKKDKRATKRTEEEFKLKHGQGQFTKALTAVGALKTINSKLDYAYTWHLANTLPWTDDGYRILLSSAYTNYMSVMRNLKIEIEAEVKILSDNFDAVRQEAELALGGHIDNGGLYDPADYPTDIASKYKFEVTTNFIPNKKDFRVTNISDEDMAEIERQIENRLKEAETNAMKELYDRVKEVLEKVYEAFSDPDANFHDSKIHNVTELMEILPKLNIAGDKKLDYTRKVIETKICTLDPKELRTDINARKSAAEEARTILAQMDEYC